MSSICTCVPKLKIQTQTVFLLFYWEKGYAVAYSDQQWNQGNAFLFFEM